MEWNYRYEYIYKSLFIQILIINFLQSNLCNLLRIRARLVEKQYSFYKLHTNYGRVFSEWSAIEKEMGDGLQV